jgi:hypothetical protein
VPRRGFATCISTSRFYFCVEVADNKLCARGQGEACFDTSVEANWFLYLIYEPHVICFRTEQKRAKIINNDMEQLEKQMMDSEMEMLATRGGGGVCHALRLLPFCAQIRFCPSQPEVSHTKLSKNRVIAARLRYAYCDQNECIALSYTFRCHVSQKMHKTLSFYGFSKHTG